MLYFFFNTIQTIYRAKKIAVTTKNLDISDERPYIPSEDSIHFSETKH